MCQILIIQFIRKNWFSTGVRGIFLSAKKIILVKIYCGVVTNTYEGVYQEINKGKNVNTIGY